MTLRGLLLFLLGLFGLAALAGCGPASATVSGEVTVNGKALEKGLIIFAALEGDPESVTANIEGGKYSVKMRPGKKRVQISAPAAPKKVKDSNDPKAEWLEVPGDETLPERFNGKSELTLDVNAGGNNKNWELDTKARKP